MFAVSCAVAPSQGVLPDETEKKDRPPPQCGTLSVCDRECKDLATDPTSCGACGRTCIIPNANAACVRGDCVISSCSEGFFDADKKVETGCELESRCAAGLDCETLCDTIGRTTCESGVSACMPPVESCNARDDDCNGRCDEGALADCRLGVHRAVGTGGQHLYTTDRSMAMTAPYLIEQENYFHIYRSEVAGLQPVFLCKKPNNKYFLTSSSICEALNIPGQQIGYWSTDMKCDAKPLYRLYHDLTADHFYTISEEEAMTVVSMYGYRLEGVPAYVWSTP